MKMLGTLLSLGGKALGGVAGLFTKFRTYLIIALIAFLVGAGGAFYVSDKWSDAERTAAAEQALAEAREAARLAEEEKQRAIAAVIQEMDRIREADFEILMGVDEKNDQINDAGSVFDREIGNYVENDDQCRYGSRTLDNGTVWLLNLVRAMPQGRSGGGEDVSAPAAPSDAEKQAPSTVTERDELEAHKDCAVRYNKLAVQHDALVDWLEQRQAVESGKD